MVLGNISVGVRGTSTTSGDVNFAPCSQVQTPIFVTENRKYSVGEEASWTSYLLGLVLRGKVSKRQFKDTRV